jgi:hypothetical protein
MITITQGNTSPVLTDTIVTKSGVQDLTNCTVRFRMRPISGSALVVDAPATVAAPATSGQVSYHWASADTAAPGDFMAWWQVTLSSGAVQDTPEFAVVVEQHAPSQVQGLIPAVRRLIADGQPSSEESPFALTRLEVLTDQIPAAATPTQTTFRLKFSQTPFEGHVTCYAIPGTLTAYLDGSPSGIYPIQDANANGEFTLASAPASQLLVSYGWQAHTDEAIAQYLDQGRAWIQVDTISQIPDGLIPALTHYAAGLAMRNLAVRCNLPNVGAGSVRADLSSLAQQYANLANEFDTMARQLWTDYELPPTKFRPVGMTTSTRQTRYEPWR